MGEPNKRIVNTGAKDVDAKLAAYWERRDQVLAAAKELEGTLKSVARAAKRQARDYQRALARRFAAGAQGS